MIPVHFIARMVGCTQFRWYRRLYGGVWERWWIDAPFHSFIWVDLEEPTEGKALSPMVHGRPVVEDYRRRSLHVPVRQRPPAV